MRWEDRELDFGGVSDELRRLFDRAKHRKLLVLFLTLLAVGAITGREMRKQRFYSSKVILSATEGEKADNGVAHASSKLQDYVYHAVFTDSALTELMKKYDYRPDLQRTNPRFALEQFRDFIDVEVYKNEFTQPRYPMAPPRSARISVSVRYTSPDEALGIARDLGDLVVKRDADIRKERFELQARLANDAVHLTQVEIDRLTRELEVARAAEETLEDPQRIGEYRARGDSAARALVGADARLKDAETSRNKLEDARNANEQSLELRYDRVDWGIPERRENRILLLVRTVLFAFFGLWPIVALTVAAFDPRVYDERDVRRLGLKSLGRVRRTAARSLLPR